MAASSYDISQLFARAFNYRALPFPLGEADVGAGIVGLVKAVEGSFNRQSVLGTPIFMPARIKGVNQDDSEWYQLPNDVITISGQKNVVLTQVAGQGRNGTVKELISQDDYQIRIQGIAVSSDADEYPEDDVRKLRQLYELNTELEIECELTKLFGIRNIVITGARWPGIQGTQEAQAYEFNCISDEDFEFELIDNL